VPRAVAARKANRNSANTPVKMGTPLEARSVGEPPSAMPRTTPAAPTPARTVPTTRTSRAATDSATGPTPNGNRPNRETAARITTSVTIAWRSGA